MAQWVLLLTPGGCQHYVSSDILCGQLTIDLETNILTVDATKPYAPSEAQKRGIHKHQAVFSLDFETWQAIIDLYDRKDCIIPHRQEEQHETRRGWYN